MRQHRARRGFSLLEILVIVAIVGIILAVLTPAAGKMIRRARALSATSEMNRVLTKARLNAIKRGFQVVVLPSIDPKSSRIRLLSWEDRNPDLLQGTYTPPGGGAAVNEVVLDDYLSQATFHLWKQGGTRDDVDASVAFDTYADPVTFVLNSDLKDRIVFLPNGGLMKPMAANSGLPAATTGRGLYLADERGKNFFRLTIPNDLVAKARVDKWIDSSTGYSPDNNSWTWY